MTHSDMRPRRLELILCLSLAAAVLALYCRSFTHDFVNFDDEVYVTKNPHVKAGLTAEGIVWAFTTFHAGLWHPLTWLSHMLDCQLFGMRPGLHHLVSVMLHAANSVLLLVVLRRMTGKLWPSAFAAALFAFHPLRVESVAWVAERKDVLSALFWLLTMWAYVRYAERPRAKRYLLVLLFLVLGLMSKATLVTMPFVLLLLDYWPLGRLRVFGSGAGSAPPVIQHDGRRTPARTLVWEKVPFLALALATSLAAFLAARAGGAVASLGLLPFSVRLANALVSYVAYMGKMAWPHHLAAYYPHPEAVLLWRTLGAVLVLAGLTAAAVWAGRRYPYLAVGWLWYVGTLVPVIGLVQAGRQGMADRFTYVPLVGLFTAIAWGAEELAPRLTRGRPGGRTALAASAGVLLSVLALLTWFQVGRWRDTVSILGHTVEVTHDNAWAGTNLGAALTRQLRLEEAGVYLSEVVRIRPERASARNNLGTVFERQGRIEEAVDEYAEALRLKPDYEVARRNLERLLGDHGSPEEAKGAPPKPPLPPRGAPLRHSRRVQDAVQTTRRKLDYAKICHSLGNALVREGSMDEGIARLREALRIRPDYADAHYDLGNVLARRGGFDEAIAHFREAVRVEPDHADAHNNLGVALAGKRDVKEAIVRFREALRIDPRHAQAHRNLEVALAGKGSLKSAPSKGGAQ